MNKKYEFRIDNKKVDVFSCEKADCPVIYLNMFAEENSDVLRALKQLDCPEFNLVIINGLEWNHDMAPWSIPPISKDDVACTAGAEQYLELLTSQIVPKAEEKLEKISWRGLAGYSLAGLFAIYSLYNTDIFSRIASVSGSLWFPDFVQYVKSHKIEKLPYCVYFSLGNMEGNKDNPFIEPVQKNTIEIEKLFKSYGIDTTYVKNPGDHYQHVFHRIASGLLWILEQ